MTLPSNFHARSNPDYISVLERSNVAGFVRMPNSTIPQQRIYMLNFDTFRNSIHSIVSSYLTLRLSEHDHASTAAQIDQEAAQMTRLVVNACVAVLYAKLQVIS